ncbi:MAG: hypothetical protein WC219_01255 [Acholeplasmataceae bacterium]
MKKLVKVALFVVVMVMVVAYSFVINRGSLKNITLDFENSGTPEWSEIVELDFENSGTPEWSEIVELDFENSGTPEWSEIVELRGFRKGFNRFNDFKNSGLPETIEFSRF